MLYTLLYKGGCSLVNLAWRDELAALLPAAAILKDTPMSLHTTLRVGGPADCLLDAASVQEVLAACRFCARKGLPLLVVGNGSNLLVRDGGVRGLTLRVGALMSAVAFAEDGCYAAAGVPMPRLARACIREKKSGLAWACGLPGTLGGALCMNAGAYGGETAAAVAYVDALDGDLRPVRLLAEAMRFSYRHSALQDGGYIALGAQLRLPPGDTAAMQAEADEYARRRREKQPLQVPSAGSFFKRPPGGFAAQMIDEAGLKGLREGGAQVSPLHAGFLVNDQNATAADVLRLCERVTRAVHERTGVWLQPEVRVVGEN